MPTADRPPGPLRRLAAVLFAPHPARRWVLLALVALAAVVVLRWATLTPEVEADFFFATDDPQLQEDRRIREIFPGGAGSLVLLAVTSPEIGSSAYAQGLAELSRELREIDHVEQVYDVQHGPEGLGEALESPFWRRLLVAEDRSATNVLVLLAEGWDAATIAQIDAVAREASRPDLTVAVSGVPYVVERIRHDLVRDLRTFGLAALAVFSLLLAVSFRSVGVLVGALVACTAAYVVTLVVRELAGLGGGLLAPSIATIVIVLTLSHVVFLTANWRAALREGGADPVQAAMRWTGPASFWSMVTTVLGFLTLLVAPARPMREFGLACAVGSLAALAAAYLIYPPFLVRARVREFLPFLEPGIRWVLVRRNLWAPLALALAVAIAVPFLDRLETDPTLLSYFQEGSAVRGGLETVDRTGGVGELQLVVRDAGGAKLNDKAAYERMSALQAALEQDPAVGVSVSLPVLMAEAKRPFFSFLLSWERRLRQLEKPKYGSIGTEFVTRDRTLARFQLRMIESGREEPRQAVVARLHGIVRDHGFEPALTGGLYPLAGKLSELVSQSVVRGLGGLLVLCAVIAAIVSRSLRATVAMTACLGAVAVCLLGLLVALDVPLDVLSSPATSVALAIGIDDMIHMTFARRRLRGAVSEGWSEWVDVRLALWRPIVASSLIVAAGFSIFVLSGSPPTQRLGIAVALGTAIALFAVLLVYPVLAGGSLARARVPASRRVRSRPPPPPVELSPSR